MYYQPHDFCEHDVLQRDHASNNLSGEWSRHDHTKYMNEYSVKECSYDERS